MKYEKAKTCKWRPDWKITGNGRLMGTTTGRCRWTPAEVNYKFPPNWIEDWRLDLKPHTNPKTCEICPAYKHDETSGQGS